MGLARSAAAVALALRAATALLPAQNPPWGADYRMNLSTISMACNSSGVFDVALAAAFGIPSFDWSNEKRQWALARPMDCEERLVSQAVATKAANPASHVFVYRNLVKVGAQCRVRWMRRRQR